MRVLPNTFCCIFHIYSSFSLKFLLYFFPLPFDLLTPPPLRNYHTVVHAQVSLFLFCLILPSPNLPLLLFFLPTWVLSNNLCLTSEIFFMPVFDTLYCILISFIVIFNSSILVFLFIICLSDILPLFLYWFLHYVGSICVLL